MSARLRKGDRVKTPGGLGTVVYVRLGGMNFDELRAVSVALDQKIHLSGYVGTVYLAENVKPWEPR